MPVTEPVAKPVPESLEGYTPQEIANMAALSKRLGEHPKTSRKFQQLVKEVVPEFRSPELEMDERLEAATKPLTDKIDKLEGAQQQRDANARLSQIETEAMQHGVTSAELADGTFKKWATEQGFGINQLALAARYREGMNTQSIPTAPPSLVPQGMTPDKIAEIKKAPGGWDKYLNNQVNDFLNERSRARQAA